jgi:hypothetical protein
MSDEFTQLISSICLEGWIDTGHEPDEASKGHSKCMAFGWCDGCHQRARAILEGAGARTNNG